MNDGLNVIADIAGKYDELILLINKMPKNCIYLSLGDMCDRGKDSAKVFQWFMENGKALLGNHEHMMLDFWNKTEIYQNDLWEFYNGGDQTLNSFQNISVEETLKIIDWIENLPLFFQFENFFISHSFIHPNYTLDDAIFSVYHQPLDDNSIIWCRKEPIRRNELGFQISGHNAHWGLRFFRDNYGEFALCLDQSASKKLTGIHLPSMKIYEQVYL